MVQTPQIGRKLAKKRADKHTPTKGEASTKQPLTPAQVMAQWEADGVIGTWADREDITDSQAYARKLREQAEHRDWD